MKLNKKQKNNIYTPLDDYEKELNSFLGKGKFVQIPHFKKSKKLIEEAAKNFTQLQKSKHITLRVNQVDLIKVKAKAKDNQIPYQTLLNSLIHQYAEGKTQICL